jgi:hypothetical protein
MATSLNTAYTAHFARQNFGYAETSYTLETLGEMAIINKPLITIT